MTKTTSNAKDTALLEASPLQATDPSVGKVPTNPIISGGEFSVSPGDVLLDRYEVVSILGIGGMGVVYRCLDLMSGLDVAIKTLPYILSHHAGEMEEIRQNYILVSKLHHPNIANVNSLERDPSTGNYFLVMEFVDGLDLMQWARRRRKEGRPLTLEEVTIVAYRIASALDYAHEQKIIHRDIKPGNIRVTFEGDVKILDFGLAAQIYTGMSHVSTIEYDTRGTAPYMAPEQWLGSFQTGATDQYALAATVYELLAGEPPFKNSNLAVLREAVLKTQAEPIPSLPKQVNDALQRALSKEYGRRFSNCHAFVNAFSGMHLKLQDRSHRVPKLAAQPFPGSRGGAQQATLRKRQDGLWDGVKRWIKPNVLSEVGRYGLIVGVLGFAGFECYKYWSSSLKGSQKTREENVAMDSKSSGVEQVSSNHAEKVSLNIQDGLQHSYTQALNQLVLAEKEIIQDGRGEKFGTYLDAATSMMTLGEKAMREGDPNVAEVSFVKSMEAAAWIVTNAPLRRQCHIMGQEVFTASKAAEAVQCHLYAETESQKALALIKKAENACERAEFSHALLLFRQAKEGYVHAAEQARLSQAESMMSKAKALQAEGCWEESIKLLDKALLLDCANQQAVALKDKAERKRVSSIRLKTMLSDKEINAQLLLNGKLYATPVCIKLEYGTSYSGLFRLTHQGKSYRMRKSFVADWKGERVLPVELHEVKPPVPGEAFLIDLGGTTLLDMVYIEPATFVMGSPDDEYGRRDNEQLKRITLLRGYWIGKYEVTQAQWRAVMGSNPSECNFGDEYPVERVSWHDAMAFCKKLTEREQAAGLLPAGYKYSLPTEAQWENACRAGTRSALNSGKELTDLKLNCSHLSEVGWYDGASTHKVGQKKPNAWGLYDMHGNVWEWCFDWYSTAVAVSAVDPLGPVSGTTRVYRGGSWINDASYCRSAFRTGYSPNYQCSNLGFRLALVSW